MLLLVRRERPTHEQALYGVEQLPFPSVDPVVRASACHSRGASSGTAFVSYRAEGPSIRQLHNH